MSRTIKCFHCVLGLAILSAYAPVVAQDEVADTKGVDAQDHSSSTAHTIAQQITLKTVRDGAMTDVLRDLIELVGGARYIGALQDRPKVRLARLTGLTLVRLGELPKEQILDAVLLLDPKFSERNAAKQAAYESSFSALLKEIEPAYRQGLAKSYLERYSEGELRELLAFFSTPTGSKYAAQDWETGGDDPVMRVFEDRADAFQSAMTAMEKEFRTISSEFPRGSQFSKLSEADQAVLSDILGISTEELLEEEPPPPIAVVPAPDQEKQRRIRNGP